MIEGYFDSGDEGRGDENLPVSNSVTPSAMSLPPTRVTIYAPDGSTTVGIGWAVVVMKTSAPDSLSLCFMDEQGNKTFLNKKVVIVRQRDNIQLWNPRAASPYIMGKELMGPGEMKWLMDHPEWPKILELESIEEGEGYDNEGLYG